MIPVNQLSIGHQSKFNSFMVVTFIIFELFLVKSFSHKQRCIKCKHMNRHVTVWFPVVRIRPGNVPWWILGTVREVFALPRRLFVLHRRHTMCGSGGHGPPPRHGLLSGLLHAPGPHQHGDRLSLPSQQGKNIYCLLSHLESLCTEFILLELDFCLSRFIGLKGKYCLFKMS